MNKSKWVKSLMTLEGLPCVTLEDGNEWALQLQKGEIYEYSDTEYGCCVYDWRAANRLIKKLGLKKKPRRRGDELLCRFPKSQESLQRAIEVLGRRSGREKVLQSPHEFIEEFSSKTRKFGPISASEAGVKGEGTTDG